MKINPEFLAHSKEYISCLVKSEKLSMEMLNAVNAVLKF